jgi:peroxiredoxin Q/BCP
MAQLRQDYQEFIEHDAEVVVVGPEDQAAFREYWERESLPFVGLADPEHNVASEYGQEVKLLRLGRMPALVVVGKDGRIHYQHYGDSMRDIASNKEVLAVLHSLNDPSGV